MQGCLDLDQTQFSTEAEVCGKFTAAFPYTQILNSNDKSHTELMSHITGILGDRDVATGDGTTDVCCAYDLRQWYCYGCP
jgi:hypothetical protein